jgi:hypothetical protein
MQAGHATVGASYVADLTNTSGTSEKFQGSVSESRNRKSVVTHAE